MKPGPRYGSLILIESIEVDAPPRDALDWLTSIISDNGWSKNSQPEEQAEAWHTAFLTYLQRELSELNRLGRYSPFVFNSSSEYQIQGAAFAEAHEPPEVIEHKVRRARIRAYDAALRQLTSREFEYLCAGILSLLRVQHLTVTKYSADRGIDFYGKLHLEAHVFGEDPFPSWTRQMSAWMIGQAKHYTGKVSTPEINNLIGSVRLLTGPGSRFPNLVIRVCDLVFHLFFTTGRMTSESWKRLDESGVIGMDGEMVAAFLAARSVGCSAGEFDSVAFRLWINSICLPGDLNANPIAKAASQT